VLCWTATLVFLIFSASSVKRTVEVDRRWRWGWPIFAVLVAVFLLFRTTVQPPAFLNAVVLPPTLWTDIFADILGLAGMAFALWGRITLGRNWNLYPSLKESHELIVRGPYQYVRHPMYTGFISMLLGAVIWYGTATGFVWFFACFLGTWFKLGQEEKLLTAHFGESYKLYKMRVKAIIPFIL
jgi:protein-S-isoprenylcysteine O-methyltransferase Ste14